LLSFFRIVENRLGPMPSAHIPEQERIAIRRGGRCRFDADPAGRARPVFDDDLLPQFFAELRLKDAPDEIGRAAGSKRNDHAHGARRIGIRLRENLNGCDGRGEQQRCK